jgi:hypothetical protein
MEATVVIRRILVLGAALALSVPALAQQPTPASTPAEQAQLDALRNQIKGYEELLRQAVDRGGQKLADWANQQGPVVILQPAARPVAHGLPTLEGGATFTVEIAEIRGLELWQEVLSRMPKSAPAASQPAGPGKPIGSVTPMGGVVQADPMVGSQPPGLPSANPDEMYAKFVRESLIDVVLDSSRILSIKAGQSLTVAAIPVNVVYRNPLYGNQSRQLILSIKGEDLDAFHQGKITRDEAKQKIVETRF